jgi:hypothetical protein
VDEVLAKSTSRYARGLPTLLEFAAALEGSGVNTATVLEGDLCAMLPTLRKLL